MGGGAEAGEPAWNRMNEVQKRTASKRFYRRPDGACESGQAGIANLYISLGL